MALPPDLPGKQELKNGNPQLQDLFPAATVAAYNPILPLLRMPVPAGIDDDPSKGPYVLAFRDEISWRNAWHNCEKSIAAQCEAGARMGCSISAVNACRGPWWEDFWPLIKFRSEKAEKREACEEREMMACIAASRGECMQFARSTCEPVFADSRIAEATQFIDPRFMQTSKRIRLTRKSLPVRPSKSCITTQSSDSTLSLDVNGVMDELDHSAKRRTNYRGSRILGDVVMGRSWEGPVWSNGSEAHTRISNEMESAPVGWEGGLVWPKFASAKPNKDENNAKNDDPYSALQKIDCFWQHCLQELKNRLSRMRL
ncbi:hypothetical protein O6H91_08G021500 [Diphasiastrum complanatum]|uniref:Uncharacterized protein n=1 Tax=Diphasiastrum complanatum TaxID=34168 RepID=A0ACC2CVM2_DIPCM|nr:hypothetical protein O6H91_08G021500 [Diphasiastrum complanatum]